MAAQRVGARSPLTQLRVEALKGLPQRPAANSRSYNLTPYALRASPASVSWSQPLCPAKRGAATRTNPHHAEWLKKIGLEK